MWRGAPHPDPHPARAAWDPHPWRARAAASRARAVWRRAPPRSVCCVAALLCLLFARWRGSLHLFVCFFSFRLC